MFVFFYENTLRKSLEMEFGSWVVGWLLLREEDVVLERWDMMFKDEDCIGIRVGRKKGLEA